MLSRWWGFTTGFERDALEGIMKRMQWSVFTLLLLAVAGLAMEWGWRGRVRFTLSEGRLVHSA
jgi:hypothetical protein